MTRSMMPAFATLALLLGGTEAPPCRAGVRLRRLDGRHGRPVLLLHRPDRGHDTDLADTTAALDFLFLRAPR